MYENILIIGIYGTVAKCYSEGFCVQILPYKVNTCWLSKEPIIPGLYLSFRLIYNV